MWRVGSVAVSEITANISRTSRSSAVLRSPLRFDVNVSRQATTQSQPPLSEPFDPSQRLLDSLPHRPRRSGLKYVLVGGTALAALLALPFIEKDSRIWLCDNVPALKSVFEGLGLPVSKGRLPDPPSSIINAARTDAGNTDKHPVGPIIEVIKPADNTLARTTDNNLSPDQHKLMEKDEPAKKTTIMQIAEDSARKLVTVKQRSDENKSHTASTESDSLLSAGFDKEKATADDQIQRKLQEEQRATAEALARKQAANSAMELSLAQEIGLVSEVVEKALHASLAAADIVTQRAAVLQRAIECEDEQTAKEAWLALGELNESYLEKVSLTEDSANDALTSLQRYLKSVAEAEHADLTKDNPSLGGYRKQADELLVKVATLSAQFQGLNIKLRSEVMSKYVAEMWAEKEKFLKELGAPAAETDVHGCEVRSRIEELSDLLNRAQHLVFAQKSKLLEQILLVDQRLQEEVEKERSSNESKMLEKLKVAMANQKNQMLAEQEVQVQTQATKYEEKKRRELARQSAAHHEHLQDVLDLQKTKLLEQFNYTTKERLAYEKSVYIDSLKKQIEVIACLQNSVAERADLEKQVQDVQTLMTSSLGLMDALEKGDSLSQAEYAISTLQDALAKCREAAAYSPFVRTVLAAIPEQAVVRGVYTLSSLEKRFNGVLAECQNVALYPRSQGFLQHFANKIYSTLVFWHVKPKFFSEEDFFSIESVSTTDLLVQAKYFLDRRRLDAAVRCMTQLEGLPRTLAQDWIAEARLLLEVRLCAEALQSYALSRGMARVF